MGRGGGGGEEIPYMSDQILKKMWRQANISRQGKMFTCLYCLIVKNKTKPLLRNGAYRIQTWLFIRNYSSSCKTSVWTVLSFSQVNEIKQLWALIQLLYQLSLSLLLASLATYLSAVLQFECSIHTWVKLMCFVTSEKNKKYLLMEVTKLVFSSKFRHEYFP